MELLGWLVGGVFLVGGAAAVLGVFVVAPVLGLVRVSQYVSMPNAKAVEREAAAEELSSWIESYDRAATAKATTRSSSEVTPGVARLA